MTIPHVILDTAFADKGGNPNENSHKSCEKHPNQKKCPPPQNDEDDEDNGGGGIVIISL